MSKKIVFSDDQKIIIEQMFNDGYGRRIIGKEFGVSGAVITRTFREIGLNNTGRHRRKIAHLYTEKQCIGECKLIKPVSEFYINKGPNGQIYYNSYCIACEAIRAAQYRLDTLDQYKDTQKKYREKNKIILAEENKQYQKDRKKKDPVFKLRKYFSSIIAASLKSGKMGQSCAMYLPYTFEELVSYIEAQFEPWMSWTNYGRFNRKTWKDNDQTTWTWNIDHIIPQSDLPAVSMLDDNFQKCWALENLRPFSSKQNNIDSGYRTKEKIILAQNKQKEILCRSNKL